MPKPKVGVYLSKSGRLKVLDLDKEKREWVLDEGLMRSFIVAGSIRVTMPVAKFMSYGWDVAHDLRNHTYLGDL